MNRECGRGGRTCETQLDEDANPYDNLEGAPAHDTSHANHVDNMGVVVVKLSQLVRRVR